MSAIFSVIGGILGLIGQSKQQKAMRKAEEARRRQMELESARRRREMIREASKARAEALANATAQGAQGSSGLQGGYAQVQGVLGRGLLANRQDTTLANRVFDANIAASKAGGLIALGDAVSGFGSIFSGDAFKRYSAA